MGHLYALDFDGVLCDSCGESSISALKVFSTPKLLFDLNGSSCSCASSQP